MKLTSAKLGLLLGALVALSMAAGANAQGRLEDRISLALVDVPAEVLFKNMSKVLDAEVEVDAALDALLTIHLERVRTRTALDAACESLGCRWSFTPGEPNKLVVVPIGRVESDTGALDTLIDMQLEGAAAVDVLRGFAGILGAELELDEHTAGKVTVDLDNETVRGSLDLVCQLLGCSWRLGAGDPAVLSVTSKAD